MEFKLMKDKTEYDLLALSIMDKFGSIDDWLAFFDIWKYSDEKYDEVDDWNEFLYAEYEQNKLHIAYSPSISEFPIVLVHLFEKDWDRYTSTETRMWNWESLHKLTS